MVQGASVVTASGDITRPVFVGELCKCSLTFSWRLGIKDVGRHLSPSVRRVSTFRVGCGWIPLNIQQVAHVKCSVLKRVAMATWGEYKLPRRANHHNWISLAQTKITFLLPRCWSSENNFTEEKTNLATFQQSRSIRRKRFFLFLSSLDPFLVKRPSPANQREEFHPLLRCVIKYRGGGYE